MQLDKRKFALVGTGDRAISYYGRTLTGSQFTSQAEIVGLYDRNPLRAQTAKRMLAVEAPVYDSFDDLMQQSLCDSVIVTTMDAAHHHYIVEALKSGKDVITEKPLTTNAAFLNQILATQRQTGGKLQVTFNYRYTPYATKVREFLASGKLGTVTSVEFHWFLDTIHGANYFRRWHRRIENSGSLWVHKATHHFDLVNWWLGQEPRDVFARGTRKFYGDGAPPAHGIRCSTCAYTEGCPFFFDINEDAYLKQLYQDAESADGYMRDACVYAEDIDIWDTMSASIQYEDDTLLTYTLHAYAPFEGYTIAFNGTQGRLQCDVPDRAVIEYHQNFRERQQYRRDLAPEDLGHTSIGDRTSDTMRFYPIYGGVEEIVVPRSSGGHGGGDAYQIQMLLDPDLADPWGYRAGSRAGAMSIMVGVAARESIQQRRSVAIGELLDFSLLPNRG